MGKQEREGLGITLRLDDATAARVDQLVAQLGELWGPEAKVTRTMALRHAVRLGLDAALEKRGKRPGR